MTKNFKKQFLKRMNYLSGHFEGIKKMLRDDKYCLDIIRQNEAVIAAIKHLNNLILENHFNTCVTEALRGKNEKEKKNKTKELIRIFQNANK